MRTNRIIRVIGIFVLTIAVGISLMSADTIFSSEASFIYADLDHPSEKQTKVRTRLNPGDRDAMENMPERIGEWERINMAIEGYEKEELEEQLGADIISVKGYLKHEHAAVPIGLLTMQSQSRASFHPPEVCYPAIGLKIVEEGYEGITIDREHWREIEEELFEPGEATTDREIQVKKLIVSETDERNIERHTVVLYFYIRDSSAFNRSDEITMVRASTKVLLSGEIEDSLNNVKAFLGEAIPLMFGPREGGEKVIIDELFDSGAGGITLGIFMYLVPLSIIFYPEIRKVIRREKPVPISAK